MQLILVSWYVANKLCCHCWMFSLSDALLMQSYSSKVWFRLVWPCRSLLGTTCFFFNRSIFLHEIGGISWLTLWRCWLHSCRMFILLVEYGLGHRGVCINWDMSFLFWSGFRMTESWARRLSLCLACKPFPGLCACTRTKDYKYKDGSSRKALTYLLTGSLLYTKWGSSGAQRSKRNSW